MTLRTWIGTAASGAAVVLVVLGLTGCGSDGSGDASSSAVPSASASATQSVSAEVSGDKGSVKTGEDLELPESWPTELALPAGVSVNNVADAASGTLVTAATEFTSVQDCVSGFQEAWGVDGVTITNVVSTSVAGGLTAELADGSRVALAVNMTGDTATALMTLG